MRCHFSSKSAVIALVLFGACDDSAEEERRMIAAQHEANGRIAAAAALTNQKARQAQLDADNKSAAAQASFLKARENYQQLVKNNLVDLDRNVTELENQAKTAPVKMRVDIQIVLRQLRTRREAYVNNASALEAESAATWDDAKARVDKQWAELQDLIETD